MCVYFFFCKIFQVKNTEIGDESATVTYEYVSPDGDANYPSELTVPGLYCFLFYFQFSKKKIEFVFSSGKQHRGNLMGNKKYPFLKTGHYFFQKQTFRDFHSNKQHLCFLNKNTNLFFLFFCRCFFRNLFFWRLKNKQNFCLSECKNNFFQKVYIFSKTKVTPKLSVFKKRRSFLFIPPNRKNTKKKQFFVVFFSLGPSRNPPLG
jgi:hypothetical protein